MTDPSPLRRVDARHYGDEGRPEGVGPPCGECGQREAVEEVDGRDLCPVCLEDDESDD